MFLNVESAGPLTTIQDLGRRGYERFGVPVSGALDELALRAANALVGNAPEAAGLETPTSVALTTDADTLMAVCGAGEPSVRINGRARPAWTALFVRGRETIEVNAAPGRWAYLAVSGGIEAPLVLGSRATYLRGGFGGWEGRALQPGDRLPAGPASSSPASAAGRTVPAEQRPPYAEQLVVEVILGPQLGCFSHAALETFLTAEFVISTEADRMGYRLGGPSIAPTQADILSEGMPLGAVQVPASGQPIVMLADRPTTGGYPKIAVVIRADVPLLAQCPPGAGRVQFRATTVAAAQAKYRARLARLRPAADDN
ncbi:MAG: biotin-dependent carboxyltransferase family protein [Anaerolineales bacterium]|nr:biotin-dependent carboxyltransferase family protein [Anaerolineales bacterium]